MTLGEMPTAAFHVQRLAAALAQVHVLSAVTCGRPPPGLPLVDVDGDVVDVDVDHCRRSSGLQWLQMP